MKSLIGSIGFIGFGGLVDGIDYGLYKIND